MGVPGLAACTTKYQIQRNNDGKVIQNSNTIDHWSAAKKNLAGTTRTNTFSSSRLGSPTKMYATGADSRLGKYGLEKGPDGRIRSNQNYSSWRTHSSSVIKPMVINTGSQATSSCSHTNGGNDIAGVLTAATNLFGVLNEVGILDKFSDGISTTSKASKGAGAAAKEGVTAGMENAKDSASLQAAISEAKADLAEIPSKLSAAEGQVKELSAKTEGLKQNADKAQADYDKNLDDIKTQSGVVNQAEQQCTACSDAFQSASARYQQAVNMQASAPAEQKAAMQVQVDAAKADMDKAMNLLQRAEEKKEAAEAELQELKGQTEGLKQAAGDAKDAYDTNIDTIETKEKEVKDLQKQQTKLDKEIPSQEKRLKKMQESEDKELKSLDKDINKFEGEQKKVDAKDVDKYDKLQKKIDGLRQKKAELQNTVDMRNLPVTSNAGGHCFQAGKINGEDVYMVGGVKVSKQNYDNLMKMATENDAAAATKPKDNNSTEVKNDTPAPDAKPAAQPKAKTKASKAPASTIRDAGKNLDAKGRMELMQRGQLGQTSFGDKLVTYEDGKFWAKGPDGQKVEISKKELEKLG